MCIIFYIVNHSLSKGISLSMVLTTDYDKFKDTFSFEFILNLKNNDLHTPSLRQVRIRPPFNLFFEFEQFTIGKEILKSISKAFQ